MIDNTWKKGVFEMKTTSFNQSSDFRDGFKWHYIFQMQHQMMCCDTNWGVGVVLIPKDPWEAEELEKGYILGKMEDKDYNKSGIDDLFFLEHFVYAKKPKLVELINMALNKFKSDLDNNILPMPYSGTKQTLLANEKQVLAMLHPTRFGEVIADEVQDGLLSEMKILQAEKKKIECEEMEARNKVMHAIGDAIALIGTDYKAKFDSRMALRFSKVK
jgi:predicted phage-related endonuclease